MSNNQISDGQPTINSSAAAKRILLVSNRLAPYIWVITLVRFVQRFSLSKTVTTKHFSF